MKIYTLLLLAVFATLSKAQTHRFIYEYSSNQILNLTNTEKKIWRWTSTQLMSNSMTMKVF